MNFIIYIPNPFSSICTLFPDVPILLLSRWSHVNTVLLRTTFQCSCVAHVHIISIVLFQYVLLNCIIFYSVSPFILLLFHTFYFVQIPNILLKNSIFTDWVLFLNMSGISRTFLFIRMRLLIFSNAIPALESQQRLGDSTSWPQVTRKLTGRSFNSVCRQVEVRPGSDPQWAVKPRV